MKIYQIIRQKGEHKIQYPVINSNDNLFSEISYDTVGEGVKDFIKLSDNIYGTFMTVEPDCIFVIAQIPDYVMTAGKLAHFNMLGMTDQEYISMCKQKIIPYYKKIQFDNNMKNL